MASISIFNDTDPSFGLATPERSRMSLVRRSEAEESHRSFKFCGTHLFDSH